MTTRRDALRGGAALAAVAMAVVSHKAFAGDDVAELWLDRLMLVTEQRQVACDEFEAELLLPAWVAPGPTWLRADGTFNGPISGWPAIENVTPPAVGSKLVRPCPLSVQGHRTAMETMWGKEHARTWYRASLRHIAKRRQQQRAERERVGLLALEKRGEALCAAITGRDDAIMRLAETGSPSALAATILIGLCHSMSTRDEISCGDFTPLHLKAALRGLHPALTGNLAESVDAMLHPTVALYGDLLFMPC